MVDTTQAETSPGVTVSRGESIALDAVLRTMPQPLLILDETLSVVRANGPFCETFSIEPGEAEGRNLYDLGNGQWNIPILRTLLEDILPNDGEVRNFRVEHDFEEIGRRAMLLSATRTDGDGTGERVLLAIEDITVREQTRWDLEAQKEYVEKIVDATRDALLILGWDLRVKAANETFYRTFEVDSAETEGCMVYDLGNGQWNIPKLRELLENVLPENNAFDDFEVEHEFEGIGRRIMVLNARRIDHLQLILLAIEDQTEKRLALDSLLASEERYRTLFETMTQSFFLIDKVETPPGAPSDYRHVAANPAFEKLTGLGDVVGKTIRDAFPEAEDSIMDIYDQVVRTGEPRSFEAHVTAIDLWIEAEVFTTSKPRQLAVLLSDISERHRAEEARRQSEERLRSAVEVGKLGLWDWEIPTGRIYWFEENYPMFGLAVGEVEPSYETWAQLLHPDDRAAAEARVKDAKENVRDYEHEYRIVRPDGTIRWIFARGGVFSDSRGKPVRMLGAMIDTTERREMEERNKVLIAELQHRTMNLLAVVQSLARKTARGSADMAEFRDRFEARLHALARVQMLLSRLDENDRVAFDDVLDAELRAVGGNLHQVTRDGPSGILLRSSTVQTIAMALHELATNAVKYGALGQPSGHLSVTWRYEPPEPGGEPALHVDWRESGVAMPRDIVTPVGTGQGRDLIERALPHQLNARVCYTLGPEGVHCTISMPVSKQTTAGSGGA